MSIGCNAFLSTTHTILQTYKHSMHIINPFFSYGIGVIYKLISTIIITFSCYLKHMGVTLP